MKLIAVGRDFLRGDRQVAFVLAVLVVHDDDHPAGANLGDGVVNRREGAAFARAFGDPDFRVLVVIPMSDFRRTQQFHRACHVLAHHVAFQVHLRAHLQRAQARVRPGERNDHDIEMVVVERRHSQADPSTATEPFEHENGASDAAKTPLSASGRRPLRATSRTRPKPVHVALDEMAAEPAVGPHRPLEVDRLTGLKTPERRDPRGLGSDVRVEAFPPRAVRRSGTRR